MERVRRKFQQAIEQETRWLHLLREEVFGDDYGNETCIDVREIGIDVAFLSEQIGRNL